MISYEREAFELFDQPGVRLTFDHGIRYRRDELLLSSGNRGRSILGEDEFILEIKTGGGMPLFLPPILDALSIRPTSFSKFKNSYFDSVSYIDDKEYSDANHFSIRPDRRL